MNKRSFMPPHKQQLLLFNSFKKKKLWHAYGSNDIFPIDKFPTAGQNLPPPPAKAVDKKQ